MKNTKNQFNSTLQKDLKLALHLLSGTGISLVDVARLIKNALDFKTKNLKLNNLQYCAKVINTGIKHMHIKDMSMKRGFELYLKTKSHLRKSSFDDIKYLGRRLFRIDKFSKMNFSELSISECEEWLSSTYPTASQFNKAHTMLHGLFEYAMKQEWVEKNVVKLISKRRVVEKEIKALSLDEAKSLLNTSELPEYKDCRAGLALLMWAGIRPKELCRIKWKDIDLEEDIISIQASTSKTGGARHIEICKALKSCLLSFGVFEKSDYIVPKNWHKKWKSLRKRAGFNTWIQDVLRHTYASYFTKHYRDLQRLQLNMGHSNLNLLRTRYINLQDISKDDAKSYFKVA